MKYNIKTAVHVTDEFTRENLIEFFEAIKSGCNEYGYKIKSIDIGEIWFIADDGRLVCTESVHHKLNNHIILNGIPENWREEMKTTEIDLQSRVNELEECLENCITGYSVLKDILRRAGLSEGVIVAEKTISKAKQLLTK